jgi:hypothetical protein
MIYLMMTDASFRAVPQATTARVEGGQVVCFNILGLTVAAFPAPSVRAFGANDALRDPDALREPTGGGVRREREMTEAPLSSVRIATEMNA